MNRMTLVTSMKEPNGFNEVFECNAFTQRDALNACSAFLKGGVDSPQEMLHEFDGFTNFIESN